MPKISVIIPIYGVEQYIERCVRSLLEQTLDNIEFIFVDDCSPDKSIAILNSIIEEYRFRIAEMNWIVRIERMPTNCGQAAVRWHGVQSATGNYIIHCDSDDWVDKNLYKAMYEKAIDDNSDIVISDYYESDGSNNQRFVKGCLSENRNEFLTHLLSKKVSWSVWNKLVSRKLYNRIIFPKDNMGEDMVLCIQLVSFSRRLSYVPAVHYYYFINNQSITRTRTKENMLNNYNALKRNADILFDFFCEDKKDRYDLNTLKYEVISCLFPLVHIKAYRDECFETYDNVIMKILISKEVKIRYKVKMIMAWLGILPTWTK